MIVCLIVAAPAFAQAPARDARYTDCLARAVPDPEAALAEGFAWEDEGGGAPARHCAAIALLGMGEAEEAAARLETLVGQPPFSGQESRAEILRQAASAWLLAEDLPRAEEAASRAITVAPDAALYVLRAQVRMEALDYAGAESDLDEALALDPANAQALMWRAQARLAQGELDDALTDAEAAVDADPRSVAARLILGDIREALRAR